MTETPTVRPRRWLRALWMALAVLVVAAAVTFFVVRRSRTVPWSQVLEATARQETVNAIGRIYAADGSEWALSTWVQVAGPDRFPASSMLVAAKAAPGQQPPQEVVTAARAANLLDKESGFSLPSLAARRAASLGRPVAWGGRRALEVDYPRAASSLEWRVAVDRESKLVQGLSLFSSGRLLATLEYRYNLALPPGFTPSP